MTGPRPADNDTAQDYIRELLHSDPTISELASVLAANDGFDLELAQEQYALAAIVAEMVERKAEKSASGQIAAGLRGQENHADLVIAAYDCMNRVLANPFHPLWSDHPDGGIAIKREARVLRARLHRACEG